MARRRQPGDARRNGFTHVVSVNRRLIQALKLLGPEAVVDMDLAAQRESLVRQQQRVLPMAGLD